MSLAAILPFLLFVYVAALFVVTAVRVQNRRWRLEPIREAADAERVSLRTRVQVKPRHSLGWWSTKTLGAMELTIGTATLQVTTLPERVGMMLGSEWFFSARETQIRRGKLRGDLLRREWIILSGISGGRSAVEVAVRPVASSISIEEVWQALLRAGCQRL
jgi:hypothetical protein